MPASAPCSTTAADSAPSAVEPQPSLMFRPSGSSPMVMTSAPARRSTSGAIWYAAPCAQSATTRRPASGGCGWSGSVASRWSRYRSCSSLASLTRPNSLTAGPASVDWAFVDWAFVDWAFVDWAFVDWAFGARSRASMSSSTASVSLTPPRPKNLIPLSLAGLWLAEMTTPNAASRAPVRYATPGVGRTPSLSTSTPELASPATTAASRNSPEARGSRPTSANGRPAALTPPPGPSTAAAATLRSMASRAVRSQPATPRTPSVPKRRCRCPPSLISLPLVALLCTYGLCPYGLCTYALAGPRQAPSERRLPLGVLRCLTGLLQAVLLPLLYPRVPGQETCLLQRRAVLRVHQGQRPGHAEAQRARLPGDAAAGNPGHHIELALRAEGHERLADQLLVHLVREVHVERPAIDQPLARAREDADPGDGLLAAAGARRVTGHHRAPCDGPPRSVLRGFCRVLRRDVRAELVAGELSDFGVVLDAGGVDASGLSHGLDLVLPLL